MQIFKSDQPEFLLSIKNDTETSFPIMHAWLQIKSDKLIVNFITWYEKGQEILVKDYQMELIKEIQKNYQQHNLYYRLNLGDKQLYRIANISNVSSISFMLVPVMNE